jgi:hypothetical protein
MAIFVVGMYAWDSLRDFWAATPARGLGANMQQVAFVGIVLSFFWTHFALLRFKADALSLIRRLAEEARARADVKQ